ncbi:Lactoylglutathione lyase [Roseivivax jejudonensis]|uniref:Lactoylglutathione lyase n=1 Tax=Roseivivax jejudonensis TaxID=1529041 RepID=A0A1X6ZX42_9RHOB|nr:VOC family protein [Roseivivax jejudonensis]SLN63810.1 Lactoylglutathione lyase [Roseivivax jejudonensis]
MKPRLRHIALRVKDLEASATFYESVFGFERVGREEIPIGAAVYLSDGVINLALLNYYGQEGAASEGAADTAGTDHFGVQVDDIDAMREVIESSGGTFYFDLGDTRKGNFERKFKDPDGIVFDISHHGWLGTDSRRTEGESQ